MSTVPPVQTVLKIALAQLNATVGDLAGNARLVAAAARDAHAQGARLVVAPELMLCGYPPFDGDTEERVEMVSMKDFFALADRMKAAVAKYDQ